MHTDTDTHSHRHRHTYTDIHRHTHRQTDTAAHRRVPTHASQPLNLAFSAHVHLCRVWGSHSQIDTSNKHTHMHAQVQRVCTQEALVDDLHA